MALSETENKNISKLLFSAKPQSRCNLKNVKFNHKMLPAPLSRRHILLPQLFYQ